MGSGIEVLSLLKSFMRNEREDSLDVTVLPGNQQRMVSIERTAYQLLSIVLIKKIPGKVFFTVGKCRGVKHTKGEIAKKV